MLLQVKSPVVEKQETPVCNNEGFYSVTAGVTADQQRAQQEHTSEKGLYKIIKYL